MNLFSCLIGFCSGIQLLSFSVLILLFTFCTNDKKTNQHFNDTIHILKTPETRILFETANGYCHITPEINDSILLSLLNHLSSGVGYPKDLIRKIEVVEGGQIKREYIDTSNTSIDLEKNFYDSWKSEKENSTSFVDCACEAPADSLYVINNGDTIVYVLFCNQVKCIHKNTISLLKLSDRGANLVQCLWNVVRKKYSDSDYGCSSENTAYPLIISDSYVNGTWRETKRFCLITYAIRKVLYRSVYPTTMFHAVIKVPLAFQGNEFKTGKVIVEGLNENIAELIASEIDSTLKRKISVELCDTIRVTYTNYAILYGK